MSGVQTKEIVSFGPTPESPYSTAVKADGLIYLSGTLAEDAADAGGGRDVGTETRLTLERMREVLQASGSSLDHVVSVMVYLTAAEDFQPMNAAYRAFFPADPPTRTTVITRLVVPDARVEISLVAVPAGRGREIVLPQGWKRSPNPYSYAIRSGDTLFLAGLVSRNGADNAFVAGDVRVQTRTIMENARQLLEAAGLTFANIVSARVYLTNAADFAAMNEVYGEYFPSAPPARATVQCGLAGPEAVVEITFIASAAPRAAIGTPPSGLPLSPAMKAGSRVYRLRDARQHCGDGRRRGGADAGDAGEDRPHARRRRRGAGRRRRRAGLSHRCRGVRRDERGVSRVLRRRFPGASDRRGAARGSRRARRDHGHGGHSRKNDERAHQALIRRFTSSPAAGRSARVFERSEDA